LQWIDCLSQLDLDASALFQAAEDLPSYSILSVESLPFTPTADGVEITTHPWIALANGEVDDVPLLHGTNADEGLLFTTLPLDATHQDLLAEWRGVQGYTAEETALLEELYGTQEYENVLTVSRAWWQSQRSLGDKWFSCPAEYTSQQLSALPHRHSATFMYHFEHPSLMSPFVIHGSELAYVFHWSIAMANQEDAYMANATCSYWGNFALSVSHDVNNPIVGMTDLPHWPAYLKSAPLAGGIYYLPTTSERERV
jgi:carboxylesterase type B